MLFNLHVKNLALVKEADIYFEEGLNILTGETGAGKSIILGSLQLALGERIPHGMIRNEAAEALSEAVFILDNRQQREELKKLDILPDEEDKVVLTRRIMKGRSVSKINGISASAPLLKEVAAILLDMHTQQEHQSLLYKRKHLAILDAYGGQEIREAREETARCYHRYREAADQLEQFSMDEDARKREADFLAYEVEEISGAALLPGEDEELEQRYRFLSNSQKIVGALESAYAMTGYEEDQSAGSLIGRACRELSSVSAYGDSIGQLYEQLSGLDGLLNDFNRELSDYLSRQQFGDQELYETEKRLDLINTLKAKYGNSVSLILDRLEEKRRRLEELSWYSDLLEEKQRNAQEAKAQLDAACQRLTALRKKWAAPLEKEIAKGLRELNFLQEEFSIHLTALESYTANGRDQAEFYMSTNPGAPMGPVASVASGGELSRIMLAIKSILAKQDMAGTLIFDEIDVGISGRTAQKVSEKMVQLSRSRQVICITHLPQIAAMADAHFVIEKNVEDGATLTSVTALTDEGMVRELARMLGGAQITGTTLKNAGEMKKMALEMKGKQ